jgi:hypothetical protein
VAVEKLTLRNSQKIEGFLASVSPVIRIFVPQKHGKSGCSLDGSTINPLHVFGDVGAATVHFHNKFCVFHSVSLLLSSAEERCTKM